VKYSIRFDNVLRTFGEDEKDRERYNCGVEIDPGLILFKACNKILSELRATLKCSRGVACIRWATSIEMQCCDEYAGM
jgi:hypothetical protein